MLLGLPLIFYSSAQQQRPERTFLEQPLGEGILYRRESHNDPRPYVLHIVTVDLETPGQEVVVSGGNPLTAEFEAIARTTSEFVADRDLQVAVNGSFFYPFREKAPWDFYPHSGDGVNVLGQGVSNGIEYSTPQDNWPALCFLANRAVVVSGGSCPEGTEQAIAGSHELVMSGRLAEGLAGRTADRPYGRVAVAVNQAGTQLWLIVVDGKQRHYSEGVTLTELAQIAAALGADAALNLDGGGSTTLVAKTENKTAILNAPIHTRLPMRQRPVANHLGIRTRDLTETATDSPG